MTEDRQAMGRLFYIKNRIGVAFYVFVRCGVAVHRIDIEFIAVTQ